MAPIITAFITIIFISVILYSRAVACSKSLHMLLTVILIIVLLLLIIRGHTYPPLRLSMYSACPHTVMDVLWRHL